MRVPRQPQHREARPTTKDPLPRWSSSQTLLIMEHLAHWSMSRPSAHGLDFDGLVDCLLGGLDEAGVRVRPEQVVFGCLPSLQRRGDALPPRELLLDRAAAAIHHTALVEARCIVMQIRGSGWLPGHRYLVLLDHAWSGGGSDPTALVWAEARGTVWPLSVAWFERLERSSWLRPITQRAALRWWRQSSDMPVRPAWNTTGQRADEQGCPTVALGIPTRA
jgi:hypothetical protein